MPAHGLVQAFDVALVQRQVSLIRVVPDVHGICADITIGLEGVDPVRVVAHAEQLHDEGFVGGPLQLPNLRAVVYAGVEQGEVACLERLGWLSLRLGFDEGNQETHAARVNRELSGFQFFIFDLLEFVQRKFVLWTQ